MPYASNKDLPKGVKQAYTAGQQTAFRQAFNSAVYKQGRDEATAFKIAHAAARKVGKK